LKFQVLIPQSAHSTSCL